MAERYSLQIPERGLPSAYAREQRNASAGAEMVGQALKGLGGALDDMHVMLRRREDKQAEYDAMAANRDYMRQMRTFLSDPDSGVYNTRKLGASRGVTSDMDAYAEKLKGEIMSGLSPLAANKFAEIEPNTRMPFWNEASLFEAKQTQENNDMIFESSMRENIISVSENPFNSEMFDMAASEGNLLIQSHMRGAPEESIRLAQRSFLSRLEKERIEAVMGTDPILANELIQESTLLLPDDKEKLQATVKPEAEKQAGRNAAEQALQRFGGEYDAAEGIAWLRETIKDDDIADAAVSEYSKRIREKNLAYSIEDERRREAQSENGDRLAMDYALGNYSSTEEIVQMVDAGEISPSLGAQLIAKNNALETRGMTLEQLKKTPGWKTMPEHQQDMLYMESLGTTPEIHSSAIATLNAGIATGETDNALVQDFRERGLITHEEERRFKASISGFKAVNRVAAKRIMEAFKGQMDPEGEKSPFKGKYPSDFFNAEVMELEDYAVSLGADADPNIGADPEMAKRLGQKALELQNEIIDEIYRITRQSPDDMTDPWIGAPEKTPYAAKASKAREDLENAVINAAKITPKPVAGVEMTNVSIPGLTGGGSAEFGVVDREAISAAMPPAMRARNVVSLYGDTISKASEEFGVPEALVYAVMEQESGGNQKAVSPGAGAIGLMQLMRDTARGLGVDPHDPHQNIRGGVKYLGNALKQYKGDIKLALIHYNAGPGRVRTYRKNGTLPSETAKYIPSVLRLYEKYRKAGKAPEPTPTATPAPTQASEPVALTREQILDLPEEERFDVLDKMED